MKTVIRFGNIGVHRIGEQESRFQDMALEGLFIKKVGRVICRFEKAEPEPMKYRVVPARSMPMTMQMKKASAENGWDYVTSYSVFHLFSSPVRANAPEQQIPPADYAERLKRLSDRYYAVILGLAVYAILQIAGVFINYAESETPYLDMLDSSPLAIILLLIFLMCLLANSIITAVSINKLMKSLSAGNTIDHNAPWQKERKTGWMKAAAFSIFFALVLVFPITQTTLNTRERKVLPQETGSLPIVRLAEIENNPGLVRDEENAGDDVDYYNNITRAASIMAPVQIESRESGLISTEKWKDRGGEYSPSISNTVYKLASPFIAERVMLELIFYYDDILKTIEGYIPCMETGSEYFDRLFVSESNGYIEMFAVKGKAVVRITYSGEATLDTIIGAVAVKMDFISD